MAEQDQQNSVPETDDLSDLEPGGDAGVNQEKSASGRSWTTVAIVAVAIFICIATLFIIFLLRNRTSEPEDAAAAGRGGSGRRCLVSHSGAGDDHCRNGR